MLPLCADESIGVMAWSPLARGRLTRDWNQGSDRQEKYAFGMGLYAAPADADGRVVEAVAAIAAKRDVHRAQVALSG